MHPQIHAHQGLSVFQREMTQISANCFGNVINTRLCPYRCCLKSHEIPWSQSAMITVQSLAPVNFVAQAVTAAAAAFVPLAIPQVPVAAETANAPPLPT